MLIFHSKRPYRHRRLTAIAAFRESELNYGNSLEIGETRTTNIQLYGYGDTPVGIDSLAAACSHYASVGSRAPDQRANASASK